MGYVERIGVRPEPDHAPWTIPAQPMPRQAVAGAAHRLGRRGGRAGRGRGGRRSSGWSSAATSRNRSANANRSRRRANWRAGAAVLAFSVLADSGLEHYRGAYHNPAMYVAPSAAAVSLVNSVHMTIRPEVSSNGRLALSGLTLSTGLTGLAFHLTNVAKRDGGVNLLNLFYGAPLLRAGSDRDFRARRTGGGAAGRRGRTRLAADPARAAGRHGGRSRRRLFDAVHDRGGGAAAFPRSVSRPVHVRPGDRAADRRDRARPRRVRAAPAQGERACCCG